MGRSITRQLLVVAGKGGVGKSTVAATLGVAAARRGLSTIVAEVAARCDVAKLLGVEAGEPLAERELREGLNHVVIDRRHAMEEYLREETPGPLPAAILARSRAFELFAAASPGLAELLTIGKVLELTRSHRRRRRSAYDLVILDAPASGHALALLCAPRTFAGIARVGPIARQAGEIDRALSDPRHTGMILVATAEQMAVSEALQMRAALKERLRMKPDAVVVNRMLRSPFNANEIATLAAVSDDPAARSALWLHARARSQRSQLARLKAGLGGERCFTLPFQFNGELSTDDFGRLADLIERGLA